MIRSRGQKQSNDKINKVNMTSHCLNYCPHSESTSSLLCSVFVNCRFPSWNLTIAVYCLISYSTNNRQTEANCLSLPFSKCHLFFEIHQASVASSCKCNHPRFPSSSPLIVTLWVFDYTITSINLSAQNFHV